MSEEINKYRCLVIDDEPLAREGIKLHIDEMQNLECTAEFGNPIKASQFLLNNSVDIIFLDIEMPGLSGIDFLKSVPIDAMVILTTAYPQYALDAFELNVVDYLLKPIKFERFFKAVNKALEMSVLQKEAKQSSEQENENTIYIKSERRYVKLNYSDIIYISGLKDYVAIHTKKGKHLTAMNIKTIFSKLPPLIFARISKSHIVNVQFVNSVEVDTIHLDNLELPLGVSYKEHFIENYIKAKLLKR